MSKPSNTTKIFRSDKVINLTTSGFNLSTGTHIPIAHIGLIPGLKDYPITFIERLELSAILVRHHAMSTGSYDDEWFGKFIQKLFCPACTLKKNCKYIAFDYFTIRKNRPICFREE